jgi:plasmid stabilization system protein ParE
MPAALAEAEEYLRFLEDECQASEYATEWWNGLIDAFLSPQTMPRRFPIIPERESFEEEMRHLIYQSHRIIFRLCGNKVEVLRIYHASRRPIE